MTPAMFPILPRFFNHEELTIDTCNTLHFLYSFQGPGRCISVQLSVVKDLCECDPDLYLSVIISVHKNRTVIFHGTLPNHHLKSII